MRFENMPILMARARDHFSMLAETVMRDLVRRESRDFIVYL